MQNINNYILEKLKINKDTSIDNDDIYEIEYSSTAISKVPFLLSYIKKGTNMSDEVNAKITSTRGLNTWFSINVKNKEDYLWLICWIYSRVASEGIHIRDEFDKKMDKVVKNYKKNYKYKIFTLFTMDEIIDKYLELRKYNNMR